MTKRARNKQIKLWVEGARLRTLPLAVAPIAIGAGAAASVQKFNLELTLLALAVAFFLQVGVNYANDYSDGIRGTDNQRVGPLRLTGSKSVRPAAVKYAAFAFFGLAALAGLAIVAAWFYTGGKSPYGYAGLGEVSVFVFFGLVATYGTAYIQIGSFSETAILGGSAAGLFASAVLMVNNIRDLDLDRHVGKRTLAVKIGRNWAKAVFFAMIYLPFVILVPIALIYPATFLAMFVLLLVLPVTLIVATAHSAKELILALKLTSFAALGYGLLLGWGLATVNFGL